MWGLKCCWTAVIKVLLYIGKEVKALVTQSCLTLCSPMDRSPPDLSVLGIFQARVLERVAVPLSNVLVYLYIIFFRHIHIIYMNRYYVSVSSYVCIDRQTCMHAIYLWGENICTYTYAEKGQSSQSYDFSDSHVWMWGLDHEEGWALKYWCFRTVVLEKTLEGFVNCMEIKPVHPKGNQPWILIGKTDAEVESPILWPPDAKNWLIGKAPDAGKDWRQKEEGDNRGWDG